MNASRPSTATVDHTAKRRRKGVRDYAALGRMTADDVRSVSLPEGAYGLVLRCHNDRAAMKTSTTNQSHERHPQTPTKREEVTA